LPKPHTRPGARKRKVDFIDADPRDRNWLKGRP